jgi:hypothetical protein
MRNPLLGLLVTSLLLLSGAQTASAWHWDNENEHQAFGAQAGDPRTQEDVQECLDQTAHSRELTCIALYPHLLDNIFSVPANTQRPADCLKDRARGWFAPGVAGWAHSGLQWYSSPGFVEYSPHAGDDACEAPRVHPERGLAKDLRLSTEAPIIGYWHLSADQLEITPLGIGSGPEGEPSAGAMPCVSVEMTLQTGRYLGQGDIIAQGTTTKTIVSTPKQLDEHPLPPYDPCPGSQGRITAEPTTKFRIDLGRAQQDIPGNEGYLVHVRWYQWDGERLPEEGSLQQPGWNIRSGPDHVNRLILPVQRPAAIEELKIVTFRNTTYIQATIDSPLGSYDIDMENLRIGLYNERREQVPLEKLGDPIYRFSIDIDGHLRPVNVTIPWDKHEENLPSGIYTLRVSAPNWQHTHTASDEITIHIAKKEGWPEAPFPVLPLLIAVIGLVWARRRAP